MSFKSFITVVFAVAGLSLPVVEYELTGHWPNEPTSAEVAAETAKKAQVAKNCAAARLKRDTLYKQGAPHPDDEVDVRQACEPDEVAKESLQHWILGVLLVVLAMGFLPLLLGSSIPSTMR